MPGTIETLESRKVTDSTQADADADGKEYDMYAPLLNYKKGITSSNRPGISINWIPPDHVRRLKAYELLWGYYNNISRDYRKAPETGDDSQNNDLVEYGDAQWLSNKIKSKLLGDNVTIMVNTERLESHIDVLTKLTDNSEVELESPDAFTAKLDELKQKKVLSPAQEAYLKDWWHDQGIYNIIEKNETKCGYMGDCVYKVVWSDQSKVVKIETIDPGFCFPYDLSKATEDSWDIDSNDQVVYRFILGWELETSTADSFHLYREVYELRENSAGQRKAYSQKAYFDFAHGDLNITDLTEEQLSDGNTMNWEDMGIDFIPFVWVANLSVQGEEPFGMSNLHFAIDALDNMITSTFDLMTNCDYLGGATLIATGKGIRFRRNENSASGEPLPIKIAPKRMYHVGEDGRITLLDTSKMQDALIKTLEQQEGRFLRNNDIPIVISGKLKGGDIPSGIALAIMMQPLVDKINPMRQQRYETYANLFYQVMKTYQQKGDSYEKTIFKGELPEVSLRFGPLLPEDLNEAIKRYIALQDLLDDETILEMAKRDGIIDVDLEQVKVRLLEQRTQKIAEQQQMFEIRRTEDEGGDE